MAYVLYRYPESIRQGVFVRVAEKVLLLVAHVFLHVFPSFVFGVEGNCRHVRQRLYLLFQRFLLVLADVVFNSNSCLALVFYSADYPVEVDSRQHRNAYHQQRHQYNAE